MYKELVKVIKNPDTAISIEESMSEKIKTIKFQL